MAAKWKSKSKLVLESWITAITETSQGKLTKWEQDFIESIAKQLARTGSLSQQQQEILECIYSEKTK